MCRKFCVGRASAGVASGSVVGRTLVGAARDDGNVGKVCVKVSRVGREWKRWSVQP